MRQVRRYAAACLLLLIATAAIRFAPSPYAPRVNVRWADGISPAERSYLERRFTLVEPEQREGQTWAYDLGDPSAANVKAVVAHPAVADTHYIDRFAGQVSRQAPRGTTLLRRDIAARWRESPVVYWLLLFAAASVAVSGAWLRSARSQRQAVNDPA